MRAAVCNDYGRLVVEERVAPVAGRGQAVVEVKAAAMNFTDTLFVQGKYQVKPPLPFVAGTTAAGVVVAVGEDVDLAVGSAVLGIGLGCFAERAAFTAANLARIPAGVDLAVAVAGAQAYSTALFALDERGGVKAGETVLVLGAGGSVGQACVDIATALGARVIGAASSQEKLDRALDLGAVAGIDYAAEDLKARARELADGGVDVVVDPVGGAHAEGALRALRSGGRYLVVGFASGEIPSLPLNQILLSNRAVIGVEIAPWDPAWKRAAHERIFGMLAAGSLHPAAPEVRLLDEATAALESVASGTNVRRVVLVP